MTPEAIQQAAELLVAVRGDRRQLAGFPDGCAPASLDEGYAIAGALADMLGAAVAGYKVGATNAQAQQGIGADRPFWGRIFAPFVLDSPAAALAAAMPVCGVEAEFVFRLGRDLPPDGAPFGPEDIAAAVAGVHPGIEVVTTYWADLPSAGIASVVADNGANAGLVLGEALADWRAADLASASASMTIGGDLRGEGPGSQALGHPLEAAAWLATELAGHGIGLGAGQLVSSGTLTGLNFCQPGETAVADFGPFGRVELFHDPDGMGGAR